MNILNIKIYTLNNANKFEKLKINQTLLIKINTLIILMAMINYSNKMNK